MEEKNTFSPLRCPTCNSPAPHLHPAVQHEGEVQPCNDTWHLQRTAQNARHVDAYVARGNRWY